MKGSVLRLFCAPAKEEKKNAVEDLICTKSIVALHTPQIDSRNNKIIKKLTTLVFWEREKRIRAAKE